VNSKEVVYEAFGFVDFDGGARCGDVGGE